ncbi:hypothetical protein [Shewanella aestuarii]|uniref:Uncharacterized protein n=1 Tax=Shewanella aestuarii TaxID=1028752 RepID=A0A6G9QNZ4_9GAMM|nr:hypothetical protein [Shewanella aestuarii]QIR16320.1 hypothetical protein HBH39_17695 [Shewanella aestuarii]
MGLTSLSSHRLKEATFLKSISLPLSSAAYKGFSLFCEEPKTIHQVQQIYVMPSDWQENEAGSRVEPLAHIHYFVGAQRVVVKSFEPSKFDISLSVEEFKHLFREQLVSSSQFETPLALHH